MLITVCPNCQRRGTALEYLAHLPLLCTSCGHGLKVMHDEAPEHSPAVAFTAPGEGEQQTQPSVTVSREPEVQPLVLSPSSQNLTLRDPNQTIEFDEHITPAKLAKLLEEIGTLPPSSTASPVTVPASSPAKPVSLARRLWKKIAR